MARGGPGAAFFLAPCSGPGWVPIGSVPPCPPTPLPGPAPFTRAPPPAPPPPPLAGPRYAQEHAPPPEEVAGGGGRPRATPAATGTAGWRDPLPAEAVPPSRVLAPPIHKLEAAPWSDGGAAVVVVGA